MFTKKALTPDEKKLAETLNTIELEGVRSVAKRILPKLRFDYDESGRQTRVFTEIRMDNLSPEVKSFALSALDKSPRFVVERTRDGSPYDCAIFEKKVPGRVGQTHEDQSRFRDMLLEGISADIQKHALGVKEQLEGRGFPIRLPKPFGEINPQREGVLAKFKSKVLSREAEQGLSMG